MNIKICDIHYYKGYKTGKDKIVEASIRTGFRGGIKIDTCKEHKGFFRDCANADEAVRKFHKLQDEAFGKMLLEEAK